MNQNSYEFDFTRNDKFYALTIPKYVLEDDTVLYQFNLKDLITNRFYVHTFRFKELKEISQSLNVLKVFLAIKQLELPEFPKTHFWKKTNKNPDMIEQRRIRLESYFHIVINDPFTRGYTEIKKMIHKIKHGSHQNYRFSSPQSLVEKSSSTRSQSLSKLSKKQIDIDELKKRTDKKSNKAISGQGKSMKNQS